MRSKSWVLRKHFTVSKLINSIIIVTGSVARGFSKKGWLPTMQLIQRHQLTAQKIKSSPRPYNVLVATAVCLRALYLPRFVFWGAPFILQWTRDMMIYVTTSLFVFLSLANEY